MDVAHMVAVEYEHEMPTALHSKVAQAAYEAGFSACYDVVGPDVSMELTADLVTRALDAVHDEAHVTSILSWVG